MTQADEINRAFSPIAQAVEDFAHKHAFRIEKCARGNSGWELTRDHDLSGTLSLLLLYNEELGLGIGSVWQFPCPQMSLLYSHFRAVRPCALESDAVMAALALEIKELAEVPFGYWTHLRPLPSPPATEPTAEGGDRGEA